MKLKTSEVEGEVLDRLVAQCEKEVYHGPAWTKYSTDWAQAGPIIERERIAFWFEKYDDVDSALPMWAAVRFNGQDYYGETPLIAAMRCYVASKLGEEVEVPNEIVS
jgi:hypothetical protein